MRFQRLAGNTISPCEVNVPFSAWESFGYPPAFGVGARSNLLGKRTGSATPSDRQYLFYGYRGSVVPMGTGRPGD